MSTNASRMFGWLWPELNLFETCREADWARAKALFRSGLVPAVILAVAAIFCAPLDKYFSWLDRVFGRESISGELVAYASIGLVGLVPLAIELPFHGRVRRCLRRELARLGEAVCVQCGCDLRANPVRRCPQCGALFDERVVKSWLERAAQRPARLAAVRFRLTRVRRWLIPELERFTNQAKAREAWNSAMVRVGTVSMFFILAACVACLVVQRVWFDGLRRLLGSSLVWSLPLFAFWLTILAYVAVVLIFRARIRRSTRERLAESRIPICIGCGYDLRELTEARCPECGANFDPVLLRSSAE